MLKLGVVLVILSLSLGLLHGDKEQREEETEIPLSFLAFSGTDDLETEFGFEVVEALHAERMKCDIKNRKEELKFTDRQDHLMRYFRQTKHAMSFPEFDELASENKKDIEANFKKTFREMEVGHFRKLSRMQVDCDRVVQSFMEDRLKRVMNYATTLLQVDPHRFTKFVLDITDYQSQLQHGLSNCILYVEKNSQLEHFERAGMSFDLCFGSEVVTLVKFLANFTSMAEDLTQKMYKEKHTEIDILEVPEEPSKKPPTTEKPKEPTTTNKVVSTKQPVTTTKLPTDLEDGDVQEDLGSGSGSDTEPTKAENIGTPKPDESPKTDESITEIPEENYTTSPSEKPTESSSKEESTTESIVDIVEEFSNHLLPGPVIIVDPVTEKEGEKQDIGPLSKEESDVADEAYETIERMQEKAEKKSQEDREESSSSREGKSHSQPAEGEDDSELSIELDLPGVDAGVDVHIGPDGVHIDSQNGDGVGEIVFEEVTTTGAHHDDDHHGHSFTTLFLLFFFVTLGILISITLLVLIIVLVRLKTTTSTSSKQDDKPLLSEQEKIAVMKKSGYVNPTYQFFDEVKDV